jgi:hypothetical protein
MVFTGGNDNVIGRNSKYPDYLGNNFSKRKYMNTKFLPLLLFLLLPALSNAQTAAELDILLETEQVNATQAARFVMGAAGLLPAELSGTAAEQAAFALALEKGWYSGSPGAAARLQDLAFLVMNVFDLKGGIMYSLFHNRRYAYREMVYLKLIQGRAGPDSAVSGVGLLQIINATLSYAGENKNLDAELSSFDADKAGLPEEYNR